MPFRIGWFTTARGEGSYQLLKSAADQALSRYLPAEIAFVFCNREPGEAEATDRFFELVRGYSFPLLTLSSLRFRKERGGERSRPGEPLPAWRFEYDRAVAQLVARRPFDIGMLAGFMLIFTGEMCDRFPLLNLHPAPPGGPAGTWQEVIWQQITTQVTTGGARVHLATPELDLGPVATYCTFRLDTEALAPLWREVADVPVERLRAEQGEGCPLFQEIRRHGVVRERPLVVETLRAAAEGRFRFAGRSLTDHRGLPLPPLDLSEVVDRSAAQLLGPTLNRL